MPSEDSAGWHLTYFRGIRRIRDEIVLKDVA